MSVSHSPHTRRPADEQAHGTRGTDAATPPYAMNTPQRTEDDISRADTEIHEDAEIHSARVIKLPPFWRDNPTLWFMQVEASFALYRITSDDSKYRYVLVNLEASTLPFVSDIVAAPPLTGKYNALKTRIIDAFGESSETKLRRLLRSHEITDEKPSNFLQRLRNLAGGQCSDAVLRTLFLEQLPDNVRSILAISEVTDLSKLALQADKVLDMSKISANQICLRTGDNTASLEKSEPTTEINELKASIAVLTKQFKDLQRGRRRSRSRNRSTGKYQRRSKSPALTQQEDTGICYYHSRFGKEAYRCLLPCQWKKNNPEN